MDNAIFVPIIIVTVLTVIELVIYGKTLEWLLNLEKIDCKCSDDTRKTFIKIWIQIYIGFSIVVYTMNMYFLLIGKSVPKNNILGLIKSVIGIFSMANLILSIQYIQNLKDIDCKCSENISREVYFIYNWIKVGFIILFFVVLCLVFFFILIREISLKMKNNKGIVNNKK
jgi:hypothetical protein